MLNLEKRITVLESLQDVAKATTTLTDRELLAIIAPGYCGPLPKPGELPAMIHAWVVKPSVVDCEPNNDQSAQERYMRMLNGPANQGKSPLKGQSGA